MTFTSIDFLIFFPIVSVIFYLMPQKLKKIWLLFSSYVFYATWNIKYIAIILICTLISFASAIIIAKLEDLRLKKYIVAINVLAVLCTLGFYKYLNLAINSINKVLAVLSTGKAFDTMEILLPIGISFYLLQALGYVIDVYRGTVEPEKNFVDYALFVSFFPQITSGPIGRAKKLLPQFKQKLLFDVDRIKDGLFDIAYGIFLKLVVADNISVFVDKFFSHSGSSNGMELLAASLFFSIQIYCDFYGYSLMALGCGKVLQIELISNFTQPYLKGSVKGFWRSWHISLTSWFTDYLYIPLGGNRRGIILTCINTMIVFLVSGLWHGAAWHYVIWGGINGFLLVCEGRCTETINKFWDYLKVNRTNLMWKLVKVLWVFSLMTVAWIFFKADSLSEAIRIIAKILHDFDLGWFATADFFNTFESVEQFAIIVASIIIMVIVDVLKENGKDVKALVFRQQVVYRWIIYFVMLYIIVCWGAYGEGFEQTRFIYFEF